MKYPVVKIKLKMALHVLFSLQASVSVMELLRQSWHFWAPAIIIFIPHIALIIRDFNHEIVSFLCVGRRSSQRSEVSRGDAIEMADRQGDSPTGTQVNITTYITQGCEKKLHLQ